VCVEGDENNPLNQGRSCPRVLALKQYVYHPDRIKTSGMTFKQMVDQGG